MSLPQKSDAELAELLETLEAAVYLREYGGQYRFFYPYDRQREFFDAGAGHRERLLIAGNQNGKCVSYRTWINHPDGSSTQAGVLYDRGAPFDVLSWDGEKLVAARAVLPICKPPEPIVRLYLSNGEWFESALNHRVLTAAGYEFVGRLLASVPCLPACDLESGRSAPFASVRRWFGTPSDFLSRCCAGLRQCDARPQIAAAAGPAFASSATDARPHSPSIERSGATAPRGANTPSSRFARPPNLGARPLAVARSFLFLTRDACRIARHMKSRPRVFRQLSTVAALGLRSIRAIFWGRSGGPALRSPFSRAGIKIVSYLPITSQEVYDFTVPEFGNYLAAGVIHHNTHAGAFEATLHMTGLYPAWWRGRRFDKPTKGWACGMTSLACRDIQQKKLCGEPGVDTAFGTGMIPKDLFVDKPSLARGVTDAYDTIQVRHVSGGVSVCRFKSYEQGRAKFQGESLDWIWFDEEPPQDVYGEGLTRTVATGGMAFMTFTPLEGWSDVVNRFLNEESASRATITMTIDDALHIPPEKRQEIIDGYAPHEREARARGVPMLGSGRIFLTPESAITEAAIENVPLHWGKLWGIDFGIGHPFAAVLGAWDRDLDVWHILHVIRMADALSIVHAAAMMRVGAAVPVAWPHDGLDRDGHTGEPLSAGYRKHGLIMLHEHAQWESGGNSTEAGIHEWDEREKTGRLKVPAHLSDWWEERRFYHRKEGKIVKIKDDIMSATRMLFMTKHRARNVPLGGPGTRNYAGAGPQIAEGVEFDVFTGA